MSIEVTDTTEARIAAYLRSLGIHTPPRTLITRVSNTYHRIEAELYDTIHGEINETEEHWAGCLRHIAPELPAAITVLDLGTVTGFAAKQVVSHLGPRIERMVCLDLSPEMISRCKAKICALTDRAEFVAGPLDCLLGSGARFDLVVTNSVLHHLIDLPAFFADLRQIIRPGGIYVAGHEPSMAFYENPSVYRWTRLNRRWRRWRKLLQPRFYLRRAGLRKSAPDPEQLTNEELLREGLIRVPLPDGPIRQLVDIHVPPALPNVPY